MYIMHFSVGNHLLFFVCFIHSLSMVSGSSNDWYYVRFRHINSINFGCCSQTLRICCLSAVERAQLLPKYWLAFCWTIRTSFLFLFVCLFLNHVVFTSLLQSLSQNPMAWWTPDDCRGHWGPEEQELPLVPCPSSPRAPPALFHTSLLLQNLQTQVCK